MNGTKNCCFYALIFFILINGFRSKKNSYGSHKCIKFLKKKIVKMEIRNLESSLGKSDIFLDVSVDEEAPAVLKERRNNVNNNEFINYIRNNYPQDLSGKLIRNFYGESIGIDHIQVFCGKLRYFFFDIDKLRTTLNSMFDKTIEQNPFFFESIKEDLKNYSNEFQYDEFKEKELNFGESLYKNVYYLFKKEQMEIDTQNKIKAQKLALLKSQLECLIKLRDGGDVFYITLNKDLKDKGFTAYPNPILKEIYYEIGNMISSSDEQFINLLYEKTKSLLNKIKNDNENSMTKKIIFTMYLIHYANKKLLLLEDLIHNMPNGILNKIYNLRKFINETIIHYGFESQTNQKYFFDIEFSRFKIIKDTLYEKEIFLEKGINLNNFLSRLTDDFNYNSSQLLTIEENDNAQREENLPFLRKYLKILEKQENLKNEIQIKIDDMKKQKTKDWGSVGKSAFKLVFDFTRPRKGIFEFFGKKPDESIINAENSLIEDACISKQNIDIDNREISKLEKIMENIEANKKMIVKLIKEYDLKTQIENIEKENKNMSGIIINLKINDKEDPLKDKFTVSAVY